MCGITGFFSRKMSIDEMNKVIDRMTGTIVHRGPDDQGVWIDEKIGVALGHRRLSILDLSPEGHQPMVSVSGRFVIVFNGEIYNYKDLRNKLGHEGFRFRGNSDTEVMLAAIELWGVEYAVQQFVGMFAFALLDLKERLLYLVRDRLGEKPLYYGWMGETFLFGSELKSLRAHPSFTANINRDALTLFLRHNYIPAPYSIYHDIKKLSPGMILRLNITDQTQKLNQYWSLRNKVEEGASDLFLGSEKEAVDELEQLLRNAVSHQMVADVPVGAFLSGGIDSTAVVALMQAQSSLPVRTFTIGFNEADYNEAEHAKAIAKYLGTSHTELYVTPQQAMSVIPNLPTLYDEPFSDSSQIPTYLVSELARKHVTVSLSGDGGDELFGGYNRYFSAQKIWNKISWMSPKGRKILSETIRTVSIETWNKRFGWLSNVLSSSGRVGTAGDKLYKLAEILSSQNPSMFYHQFVSHWKTPEQIVIGAKEPDTIFTDSSQWTSLNNFEQHMMFMDMASYLPDDILVKVDRAAMGVSLETRIPMLDYRLVEFAWRLPMSMKIRNGQGKWLLRQVLYQYVPKELIERPKMGFGVPIDSWLRGPLREWAEDLLDEKRLREEGFFQSEPILEKWKEHQTGRRNWQYYLWDVLMFQAWLRNNR